jgi:hypothetical protein
LPGIFPKLRKTLTEVLTEIDMILQANERTVLTPGLRGDAVQLREVAKEMKEVMQDIVTPYLKGALESSLGNEAGAKRFNDLLVAPKSLVVAEEDIKEEEGAKPIQQTKGNPDDGSWAEDDILADEEV